MEAGTSVCQIFPDKASINKKRSHPYERQPQYYCPKNEESWKSPVKSVYRIPEESLLLESDIPDFCHVPHKSPAIFDVFYQKKGRPTIQDFVLTVRKQSDVEGQVLYDWLYRQPLIKDCSILQRSYRTVPRAKGLPVSVQAWIKAGQSVRYNKNVYPDIVAFRVVSDKDHALKNPLKQFSNIFSEQFRVSSEKRAYRFRNSSPYGVSSL